jgi:hypothetical protein
VESVSLVAFGGDSAFARAAQCALSWAREVFTAHPDQPLADPCSGLPP